MDSLEEGGGFEFTRVVTYNRRRLLEKCEGVNALVFHCGTVQPMASARRLLLRVKNEHPGIKIGLQTNAIHPSLKDVADFYIEMPLTIDDLEVVLRGNIR